ncbi:MAG: hypothetical protein ACRYGM_04815 [Janthinobacterium lividum]
MLRKTIATVAAASLALGLAACDPYSPGQRAVGGGLLGAGGGTGAGIGALAGGGLGAVGGAATTPSRY